ncbi:probable E3 ubiquitin-protein ligase HERC3 isoform X1 [Callorhinchus milii]|uniref:probable E3 ubiquitin-protein ligase HERC3 isoform X1 n=1 Tax=Callorhinchus milii TaxID=7868 RepID=UPI001C3F9CC6|nr:probable E3 ubiquitin-protein ligase HERC3 isoform X1 [Callorhinchus milii]
MLCWGQVGCKQLGLTPGQYGVSSEATHSDRLLKHGRVRHICCGDGITVFVFVDRKVLYTMSGQKQRKLGYINEFKKERIHFVDSEASRVVFITEGGNIFSWTLKENRGVTSKELRLTKPELLKTLCQTRVIQVACGKDHSLALCKDGQLIAWGQNAHGQLGLGTKDASHTSPQCLKSMAGIPIAQIAAGGAHSFALSVSGAVFGWGRNDRGQLGLGDTEDRHKPTYVKPLEGKKTIHISCGEEHTAVLTKDGSVFTFGAGSFGQLGHNKRRDEIKPRLVAELFAAKVSQIACGSYHTLVLVPSSDKVYAFGQGKKGQLGSGHTGDQLVPLPVKLASHTSDTGPASDCEIQPTIRRIFAGENQSFVDCFEKEVQKSKPVNLATEASVTNLKKIATVDHFLSEQLQTDYKRLKKNKVIQHLFSSAQSLNGSFLDSSKDKHFKTGREESGLDMSAVRSNFKKLAENPAILKQAINTVENCLIPSLPDSLAGVEALRVYLILPELVSVLEESPYKIAKLLGLLSRSILLLKKDSFEILESLWRTLSVHYFRKLVELYRSSSKHLVEVNLPVGNADLFDCLTILQALYKVNGSRDHMIPENDFHIPLVQIIKQNVMPQMNVLERILQYCQYNTQLYQMATALMRYPCIFDLDAKVFLLQTENAVFQAEALQHQNMIPVLQVARNRVLQSTLECLRFSNVSHFRSGFWVQFTDESCYGHGVSQEFFSLFTRALYESKGIFTRNPNSGLLWFPNQEPEFDDVFRLVGILVGLALQKHFLANFRFPLALYKKLLQVQPTLDDLKELFPVVGSSLQKLLDYKYDDVEDVFCLDFTVMMEMNDGTPVLHELIPKGKETPVQKHNRKQFVDAYVDYVFNTSVQKHFTAFATGFRSSFPLNVVNVFQPVELRAIVHGNTEYEWKMLEEKATYNKYKPNDQTIKNFWTVFNQLPEEEKKNFLAFLTGSDRIPVEGIGALRIRILRATCNEPDLHYPRAYTCTNTLDLPNYSSLSILKQKVLHAIKFGKEFNAIPP